MLIGSHFVEATPQEMSAYTHRFIEGVHSAFTQQVAHQITLLFALEQGT